MAGTEAGPLLILAGNNDEGTARAVARHTDGTLQRRLELAPGLIVEDAVVLAGPDDAPVLVVVADNPASGTVRLVAADLAAGAITPFRVANLAAAATSRPSPTSAAGPRRRRHPGHSRRRRRGGRGSRPPQRNLLAAPEFPGGYLTDRLLALGPGYGLAALGRAAGTGRC